VTVGEVAVRLIVDPPEARRERAEVPTATLSTAAKALSTKLRQVTAPSPVTHIYDPLTYAWDMHNLYATRYGAGIKKVLFLGMNPGPFGMAQTGVPFGEVAAVRDWLKLDATVHKPAKEHPKRPITGLKCTRSEVSGRRLWGLFAQRFGTPDKFFRDHFVVNWCPLAFMEESGRNFTPDHLPKEVQKFIQIACDQHLIEVMTILQPTWLVGVGRFAAEAGERIQAFVPFKLATIPHPSPANPAANKDWAGAATKAMIEQGVWVS
jgi:single-strand selective monofunctional uracil DNA glycosylase